jgi:thioredoxin-like negative regulator of GroEL
MSLLNDALRKKRSERDSTREASNLQWSTPGLISDGKRKWIIVSGGIALLAAVSAFWLVLNMSPVASGRTGTSVAADLGMVHEDGNDEKAASSSLTASQTYAPPPVVPTMAVAATPAVSTVPGPADHASAEKLEVSPPPQSSPPDHGPSSRRDGSSLKHAETRPALNSQPSRELSNSKPQAIAAVAAGGVQPSEADRLFQRACQFHRRHGLDQAIALYQSVIKEDPKHAQARFNLVAAYLQSGAYSRAYPMAAELYAEDPGNQQVMLNLAIAHIGCGRYGKALSLLEKAAKRPDAPLFEVAFHKAVALGHLGRSKAAMDCYRQAEILRPDDSGLLFNMAVAYDQQQQYGDAVDYYFKYLEHVRESDPVKIKEVRRRMRTLQAYGAEEKLKGRVRE